MSVPSLTHNQVKILIPTHNYLASLAFLLIFTISAQPFSASPTGSIDRNRRTQFLTHGAMKVHPVPSKKRNITVQYDLSHARSNSSIGSHHKKLRRLPHIFSRVLELPFRSDADVEVEEGPGFFRFVAETDGIAGDVRAHTVEIHPGVTKIVVRPNIGPLELLPLDQLELDMWRFRLPESTRPELASAVCVDGELIVTVPKGEEADELEEEDGEGDAWGGGNGNRLVIVQ